MQKPADAAEPSAATQVPAVPADDVEFATARRVLSGPVARLVELGGMAFIAFHLLVLLAYPVDQDTLRAVHVFGGAVLGFAGFIAFRGDAANRVPVRDWLLIALCVAIATHFVLDADAIEMRTFMGPNTTDLVLMSAGILVVLEFARRTAGLAMPIICVVFLAYIFVGPWMPGVLYHRGVPFGEALIFLGTKEGILGTVTGVSSTFIIMFVTFAAFLQTSQAGEYFNDLAMACVGWARGGAAKVAVLSSAMFGTISGSSVANVVASGTFTIPMMRRAGYDRATAGAVEATASTGGQITPPVMGAGAFIMAEVLGRPYIEIAVAGIIPAFLFYVAAYAHADLHALKTGMHGLPRSELPRWSRVAARAYMLSPLALLIYGLMIGFSPFRAAAMGIAAALVIMVLTPLVHRLVFAGQGIAGAIGGTLNEVLRGIGTALTSASRESLQLVAVCAAAGIVGGVINLTGVGGRFANLLLQIAGDFQVLALVFAMVVAAILGMGVPTTAAYAIAAAVVAPGLIRIGVPPLVAHMFIFYYATLSAITPPVALASFAAAGLAGADMWKTSMIALQRGLATFIVPFMFWESPALLGEAPLVEIAHAGITAFCGVVALAMAMEGWLMGRLSLPLRGAMIVAALMLMVPEGLTDLLGFALACSIGAFQWFRRRAAQSPA